MDSLRYMRCGAACLCGAARRNDLTARALPRAQINLRTTQHMLNSGT
jgi:hypothetical protein